MARAARLDDVIALARSKGASDLHLRARGRWRMRVGRALVELDAANLDAEDLAPWATLEELRSNESLCRVAPVGGLRLRAQMFRDATGVSAVVRLPWPAEPALDGIGLDEEGAQITALPRGLVVISGAAGAGKSTTAVAIVAAIDRTRSAQIITIEDPIEHLFTSRRSMILQREIGRDAESLGPAIDLMLNFDPCTLYVSELTEPSDARAVAVAASLGHFVLTTLTAPSTVATIESLHAAVGPRLADILAATLHQRLVEHRGRRVAVFEYLRVSPVVANVIRQGRFEEIPSLIQAGASQGMRTLEASLASRVLR